MHLLKAHTASQSTERADVIPILCSHSSAARLANPGFKSVLRESNDQHWSRNTSDFNNILIQSGFQQTRLTLQLSGINRVSNIPLQLKTNVLRIWGEEITFWFGADFSWRAWRRSVIPAQSASAEVRTRSKEIRSIPVLYQKFFKCSITSHQLTSIASNY